MWLFSAVLLAAAPADLAERLPAFSGWMAAQCGTGSHFGTPSPARCEIYAVRVVAAQEGPATHERPPKVLLEIEEVLFGSSARGDRLRAVFSDGRGGGWCGNEVLAREAKLAGTPIEVPAVGSQWVVSGGWSSTRQWFDVQRPSPEQADELRALAVKLSADPAMVAERADLDAESRAGIMDRRLAAAAAGGDLAGLNRLLAAGARPGWDGKSEPLQEAVRWNRARVALRLLSTGSQDVLRDGQAKRAWALTMKAAGEVDGALPPLHAAAAAGDQDLVGVLLTGGVDPDLLDAGGATALSHALESRKTETVVSYLLTGGASPNAGAGGCATLLEAASRPGALTLVELLLKHGVDTKCTVPAGTKVSPAVRDLLIKAGVLL